MAMGLDLPRLIILLGYLIALLGAIPLFPHLPLLPKLIFVAGMLTGLVNERRTTPLVPHLLLTIGSVLLFLWYASQFSRTNPALPVVSILTALLGTRLAAEKSARTWLQTGTIALFCLAASSLFDLGPRFLLFLTLMLPLLALLLVLLTFQSQAVSVSQSSLRKIVMTGLAIPLAALLLTPLFFPVLPRTQLPLWNFIQQPGGTQPAGLADTVTPGISAQIPSSGLLVFRAELPRLSPNQLYWRGPSFSRLDGLQWLRDPLTNPLSIRPGPATVNQFITMEPGNSRDLVGLDLPLSYTDPNGRTIQHPTWNRSLPPSRRLRYSVQSATDGQLAGPPPLYAQLTRLPDETPARLRQLSAEIRSANPVDRQRLDALERWFRTGSFSYSRTDLPTGDNALEQFLFQAKRGHCEFFASSFALLARGAGLPTRLVGGYYGGDYNELGGYYRVSEERAHVWTEVWINGTGWQRVDPSSFAINADAALGESRQRSLGLRLRLLLDSLDHSWNTAVITYDFEQQLQAATRLHGHLQTLRHQNLFSIVATLAFLLFTGSLIWLARRFWHRGLFDRRSRLLRRFRRQIEHDFGISRHAPTGLFDIARQTGNPQVQSFVEGYASSLYHDRQLTRAEYRQLLRILRSGFTNSPNSP